MGSEVQVRNWAVRIYGLGKSRPTSRVPRRVRVFAGVTLSIAVVLSAASAFARPEIPGQLQEVAGMKCVPLCTMCHLSNPGDVSNVGGSTKPLAGALLAPIASQRDLTPFWNAYAQAHPTEAGLVRDGKEPSSGQDVCGPIYGCAVHVEKETTWQRDYTAPLIALGAMALGALVRRRKRS